MKRFKRKTDPSPKFDPPGPSPWYLRGRSIETETGTLTWTDYGNDRVLAGVSRLQTRDGKDLLILDFGCYVKPLNNGHVLLWYQNARNPDTPLANPFIHFDIIDLCASGSIPAPRSEAERMRKEKTHRVVHTAPLAEFTCFSTLQPGKHDLNEVPPLFADVGEILVLADYCPDGNPGNNFDHMCRAIFAFGFSENEVEVVPQDWFNNGAYDFGYQWITRVARDPETRRILGEGIRLGFFRLDATFRSVEEWLVNDPFYGPR